MFKFFKEKLKGVIGKFAKEAEKAEEQKPEAEALKEEIKTEKKEEIKQVEIKKIEVENEEELVEEVKPAKKGFFAKLKEKIVTTSISEKKFDELFWELEVVLLENNVAVEAIEKIKTDLKEKLIDNPIKRGNVLEVIKETLKKSVEELFVEGFDFVSRVKSKKPFIICFVGINGSGKTTTIAKVVNLLQKRGLNCVLAAADTFRAASIEQLQEHADKLKVKMIRHDYKSDPAAVAFDAIKHAEAKNVDVVLIDTAGRQHSNANLLKEMEKIVRIAKPDLKIFVGESITGNDAVEQAKKFNESIGIDGIILSKADVDEKGGAAISVSYVTGKPILFLGVGQRMEDLEVFNKEKILKSLF